MVKKQKEEVVPKVNRNIVPKMSPAKKKNVSLEIRLLFWFLNNDLSLSSWPKRLKVVVKRRMQPRRSLSKKVLVMPTFP